MVAYSTLNQHIDPGREAIILQRSLPDEHKEARILTMTEERIARGVDTFTIAAIPGVQGRRVVGVVRLLGVVVGHIWAAESAGPLHPDAEEIMAAAAKQAAILFQVQEDLRRKQQEHFVALLLAGSHDEQLLARYLGVKPACNVRVVAVRHGGDAELRPQVEHLTQVIARRLETPFLTLPDDDRLYVVFYCDDVELSSRLFTDEIARVDERLLVGVGRIGRRLGHALASRRDADSVIAYLEHNSDLRVGSTRTLRGKLALMRVAETLSSQSEPFDGPLRGFIGLEPRDRREAIDVLNAYFESSGNISEAARQLHLHPNTFRYRMAKIADALDVDLEDREDRLLLELDLLRERFA